MLEEVTRCDPARTSDLETLLSKYQMEIVAVEFDQAITGSFWGDEEAGLVDNRLYIRPDTPVHSALHEACHYICMDGDRRSALHTDAAGDYDEENAVCYLQVLLAGLLPDYSREQMFADMDSWGYSFRLGSSKTWFEEDADDARQWLLNNQLIDDQQHVTFSLRN
ncbi:MAG: hypothetical protein ACWA5Q_10865 [bacterium]